MPYKIAKPRDGHGYMVTSPHGIKGKNMTLKNAKRQIRLLEAIEHNPEFAEKIRRKK